MLVLGELSCWAIFGVHKSDPRLMILGSTGVAARVLMLARICHTIRNERSGALRRGESLRPVWEAADAVSALDQWAAHLARYHPRLIAVDRALQRVWRDDVDAAAHRTRVVAERWRTAGAWRAASPTRATSRAPGASPRPVTCSSR